METPAAAIPRDNTGPRGDTHIRARTHTHTQIAYSLICRREGSQATVDAATDLGIATLAYYPLAMGLLTGKLSAEKLRGGRDGRSRDLVRYLEGGAGGTAGRVARGGVGPVVEALDSVASARGKTPAQVAVCVWTCV